MVHTSLSATVSNYPNSISVQRSHFLVVLLIAVVQGVTNTHFLVVYNTVDRSSAGGSKRTTWAVLDQLLKKSHGGVANQVSSIIYLQMQTSELSGV